MRSCIVCGASLDGMRSDARHCGPPCRAEASRLRGILDGNAGPYESVRERMAAFSRSHPLGRGEIPPNETEKTWSGRSARSQSKTRRLRI
jgi:hypothetical protein